jgi:hypothetical protein
MTMTNLPPGCTDAAIEAAIADGAETLDEIRAAINEYQRDWRNPQHAPLGAISEPYALNPKETGGTGWPALWPNHVLRGVYFLFDVNMDLVYIGKASCNSSFVQCFTRHFSGGMRDPRATARETWLREPAYVASLAMAYPHEAPALEEFLIERFGAEIENYAGNPHHPRKIKTNIAERIWSGRPLAHCFTG